MAETTLYVFATEKAKDDAIQADSTKYTNENTFASLTDAVNAASTTEATTITVAAGTYDEDITLDARYMAQKGDIKFIAAEGADVTFTGLFTIGYYEKRIGSEAWRADVAFENITFDQATDAKHSIDIQQCNDFTMTNCKVIGDGEYGINGTNVDNGATITGCTFENAAIQSYGNFGSNLLIEDCTFDESRVNMSSGNGVTISNCTFDNTLTDAANGDSFYVVRSNAVPVKIEGCTFDVDSTASATTVPASEDVKGGNSFAVFCQRIADNNGEKVWSVENVEVNFTEAAKNNEHLHLNFASKDRTQNSITITNISSETNDVADLLEKTNKTVIVKETNDAGDVLYTTTYADGVKGETTVAEGCMIVSNSISATAVDGEKVTINGVEYEVGKNAFASVKKALTAITTGADIAYTVIIDGTITEDINLVLAGENGLKNSREIHFMGDGKVDKDGNPISTISGGVLLGDWDGKSNLSGWTKNVSFSGINFDYSTNGNRFVFGTFEPGTDIAINNCVFTGPGMVAADYDDPGNSGNLVSSPWKVFYTDATVEFSGCKFYDGNLNFVNTKKGVVFDDCGFFNAPVALLGGTTGIDNYKFNDCSFDVTIDSSMTGFDVYCVNMTDNARNAKFDDKCTFKMSQTDAELKPADGVSWSYILVQDANGNLAGHTGQVGNPVVDFNGSKFIKGNNAENIDIFTNLDYDKSNHTGENPKYPENDSTVPIVGSNIVGVTVEDVKGAANVTITNSDSTVVITTDGKGDVTITDSVGKQFTANTVIGEGYSEVYGGNVVIGDSGFYNDIEKVQDDGNMKAEVVVKGNLTTNLNNKYLWIGGKYQGDTDVPEAAERFGLVVDGGTVTATNGEGANIRPDGYLEVTNGGTFSTSYIAAESGRIEVVGTEEKTSTIHIFGSYGAVLQNNTQMEIGNNGELVFKDADGCHFNGADIRSGSKLLVKKGGSVVASKHTIGEGATLEVAGGTLEATEQVANNGTFKVTGSEASTVKAAITGKALQLENGVLENSEINGTVNVYGVSGNIIKNSTITKNIGVGSKYDPDSAGLRDAKLTMLGDVEAGGVIYVGDAQTSYKNGLQIGDATAVNGERNTADVSLNIVYLRDNSISSFDNATIDLCDQLSVKGVLTINNSSIANVGAYAYVTVAAGGDTPQMQMNGSDFILNGVNTHFYVGTTDAVGDAVLVMNDSKLVVWDFAVQGGGDRSVSLTNNSVINGLSSMNIADGTVVSLTGSRLEAGAWNEEKTEFTGIELKMDGAITMDAASSITAGTLTGDGLITVNAAGFSGAAKVVDLADSTDLDIEGEDAIVKVTGNDNAYLINDVAKGDTWVTDADKTSILLDAEATEFGKTFSDGKYVAGINAFDSADEAIKAMDSTTKTIYVNGTVNGFWPTQAPSGTNVLPALNFQSFDGKAASIVAQAYPTDPNGDKIDTYSYKVGGDITIGADVTLDIANRNETYPNDKNGSNSPNFLKFAEGKNVVITVDGTFINSGGDFGSYAADATGTVAVKVGSTGKFVSNAADNTSFLANSTVSVTGTGTADKKMNDVQFVVNFATFGGAADFSGSNILIEKTSSAYGWGPDFVGDKEFTAENSVITAEVEVDGKKYKNSLAFDKNTKLTNTDLYLSNLTISGKELSLSHGMIVAEKGKSYASVDATKDTYGDITVAEGATLKLSDAVVNADGKLDVDGSIEVSDTLINAADIDGVVDFKFSSEFVGKQELQDNGFATLVDLSDSADLSDATLTVNGGILNGYVQIGDRIVGMMGNDIVVGNASQDVLYVNSDFSADKTFGFGYNAFASSKDALEKANELGGATINLTDEGYVYSDALGDAYSFNIQNAGTYQFTGGNGVLVNYAVDINKAETEADYIVKWVDANVTMTKLTFRDSVTATITGSVMNFKGYLGNGTVSGPSYLSVYRDSTLTIDNSTVGLDISRGDGKFDDPTDDVTGDGIYHNFGARWSIYGSLSVTNSTIYAGTAWGNDSFDIYKGATASLTNSTAHVAHISVGDAWADDGKLNEDRTSDSASLVLDNTKVYNTMYQADGGTNPNGLIVGSSSNSIANSVTIKNNSVVDMTLNGSVANTPADKGLYVGNADSSVSIESGSSVFVNKADNAGTISIVNASMEVEGTLNNARTITIDEKSLITVGGSLNNSGTINVNITDGEKGVWTIIDGQVGTEFGKVELDAADAVAGTKVKVDEATGNLVVYNVDTETVYVNSEYSGNFGKEVETGKFFGINAFNKFDTSGVDSDKGWSNLMVLPETTTEIVLAAGNGDDKSYGMLRPTQSITVKTEGDGFAVIDRFVNVIGNLTFAEGSNVKVLAQNGLSGANNQGTETKEQSFVTINGTVWFANANSSSALYFWGLNKTPGQILINAGGKFIAEAGDVENRGTLTVKGYMELGAAGSAPKLAGVGMNTVTHAETGEGHLIVDGSDGEGKLVVKHNQLNFGGGNRGGANPEYNNQDWFDAKDGCTVTVKNGGVIESAAVTFRNGKNNTLTLNNGSLIFKDYEDIDYSNINSPYFDNKGIINASNNSVIDFADRAFTNDGSMTVNGSTFAAGSLENNGSFELSGVVTVDTVATGNALNAAYATTLKDSKLTADVKLNSYAVMDNSSVSGNLTGTANLVISGTNTFAGSFDKNISVSGDYVNSTLTVKASAFNGNYVAGIKLNLDIDTYNEVVTVNTAITNIKSVEGFEVEAGIAGQYIFTDTGADVASTDDDVTYRLVQNGNKITFEKVAGPSDPSDPDSSDVKYTTSDLVVTNDINQPKLKVEMAEGYANAYVGYKAEVEIGAMTKHENGGTTIVNVAQEGSLKVNGDIEAVNYLATGYKSGLTAENVSGTGYNDVIAIGTANENVALKSLDLKAGYNTVIVGYDSNLTVGGTVGGNVDGVFSFTTSALSNVSINGDYIAAHYANTIAAYGESMSITGNIVNDDINIGTYIVTGWDTDFSVSNITYLSGVVVSGGTLDSSGEAQTKFTAKDITGTTFSNVFNFGYGADVTISNIDGKGGYNQIVGGNFSDIEFKNIKNVQVISIGAASNFKAEAISNVATVVFAGGLNADNVAELEAGNISASTANDLIYFGNYAKASVGNVTLGEGHDTFIADAFNDVTVNGVLDLGAGINTISIGYDTDFTVVGDINGVYSMVFTGGVSSDDKADFTATSISGTEYNDAVVFGNFVEATIGDINGMGGYDTIVTGYDADVTTGDITDVGQLVVGNGVSADDKAEFTATSISGTEYNDAVVFGNFVEAKIGDINGMGGYDTIVTGVASDVTAKNINGLGYLAVNTGLNSDTETKFTADNVTGTDLNDVMSFSNYNDVKLDSLTLGEGSDYVALGAYSELDVEGKIDFGEGNDNLVIGNFSEVKAGSLDFGENDYDWDALTLGYQSTIELGSNVKNAEAIYAGYGSKIIVKDTTDDVSFDGVAGTWQNATIYDLVDDTLATGSVIGGEVYGNEWDVYQFTGAAEGTLKLSLEENVTANIKLFANNDGVWSEIEDSNTFNFTNLVENTQYAIAISVDNAGYTDNTKKSYQFSVTIA